MATSLQVRNEIVRLTGVPESITETVNRRLGEAELVPHRKRGRHAEHYQAIHVAHVLVGVLAVTDGLGSTVTRAGHAVQRVSTLQMTDGPGIILKWEGKNGSRREKIAHGGNFLDAVAGILEAMRGTTELSEAARHAKWQVGLAFGANSFLAYVSRGRTIEYVRWGEEPKQIWGAGMVQDVHVTGEVLRGLADLLDLETSSSARKSTLRNQPGAPLSIVGQHS